ncbi:hypothetical protein [Sporosarcina sp. D27]|nr:hypothetical protein [Sporosarcina sp. D27]
MGSTGWSAWPAVPFYPGTLCVPQLAEVREWMSGTGTPGGSAGN